LYSNNGRPFSNDDFTRLRRIAEGNPDEQKIGFFGVGFYSLFSICEEPLVTSGGQSLLFVWKGDNLFTRKGVIPDNDVSEWTSFYLNLREPMDLPNSVDFGKFLINSMAFTSNIRQVSVYVNEDRIQFYNKKISAPRPLTFPNGEFILNSPNSFFKLQTVTIKNIQLDVNIKEEKINFLGSNKTTESECTIYMRIAVGSCSVTLPNQIEKEMERTTKKKPPQSTDIQIIFSNYDEYEGSINMVGTAGIFQDLLVNPGNQGRIFIGFPTHQTTGCSIQVF
jgi:hypothetical protein